MAASNRQTTPLKFDLVDLPDEGRWLTGEVSAAQLQLENEPRRAFAGPLRFQLHLSPINSGHDLLVQGTVEGAARVRCDRCDEPFTWDFSTDELCHTYDDAFGKTIDLTEQIREDILLLFPQQFLCREECLGLCPQCGANLNDGPCGCPVADDAEAAATETPAADNPWAALDGFRLPRE